MWHGIIELYLFNMIQNPLAGKTVLVVDDEPHLRDVIASQFKTRGCKVFEAESGNSAAELLKIERVDFVVSDVRMPDGDGITLLKSIRERDPVNPKLLFISGYSDLTHETAQNQGALGLIAKPFRFKDLADTLIAHL